MKVVFLYLNLYLYKMNSDLSKHMKILAMQLIKINRSMNSGTLSTEKLNLYCLFFLKCKKLPILPVDLNIPFFSQPMDYFMLKVPTNLVNLDQEIIFLERHLLWFSLSKKMVKKLLIFHLDIFIIFVDAPMEKYILGEMVLKVNLDTET